jgi:hypothetical protein
MRFCQVNKHIFDINPDGEVLCRKCSITYLHYTNQIEQHAAFDRLAINPDYKSNFTAQEDFPFDFEVIEE